MRILILTQWYPPEPLRLMHELAQTLQESGHEVQVLTGFPNYPSGKLHAGYRLRPWMREKLEGVDVVRAWLYPEHSRSGLMRVLNYLSFAISTTLLGIFLMRRPDVLFVYHPPLTIGLPAWVLSRLWRVPFVYQIQDLWPETLQATSMINNGRALRAIGRFAGWVYRRAAAIVVISPGFRDNLRQKGAPPGKVHLISNWVDSAFYRPSAADPAQAQALGLAGTFNVMFAGNIGAAQGLETVIAAAILLQDLPDVQFVVVGDGMALADLQALAARRQAHNVRFLGRYPNEAMSGLYALADVLLIHLKDDPLFRITIPHKTFAYMASGKPILAATAGDTADLITGAGAGIACPPEDPQALAEAVRSFYALSEAERRRMAARGLETVRTQYNRSILVDKIAAVLDSVVR
jgi:colanic acid biosynthesis glycosyl transferase WcaI